MLQRYPISIFFFFSNAIYINVAHAGDANLFKNNDLRGSKDHSLISRYPDTHIVDYRTSDFDEASFPSAKSLNDNGSYIHPKKSFSGKLTTLAYQTNGSAPFFQVLTNYTDSLKKAGFNEFFSCEGASTCGPLFILDHMNNNVAHQDFSHYPRNTDYPDGERFGYWGGTLSRSSGDVTVGVLVGEDTADRKKIDIVIDIVESKPMQSDLVTVNAKFLSDAIEREGKVVLDGIFFDSDKATVKPESAPALKAISDFLIENKSAKVFIVGHTDTTGDYKHNMELSAQRAASVANNLIATYKIDRSRLQTIGIGPVSPRSSNLTSEGKAKNRRVEMVLN